MCRRLDSITAMSAAANQLSETCDALLHGAPVDHRNPVRTGIRQAIRKTFRELQTTPADMAVSLKRMK
jgi:hypothetical protein